MGHKEHAYRFARLVEWIEAYSLGRSASSTDPGSLSRSPSVATAVPESTDAGSSRNDAGQMNDEQPPKS
jgi:hypothetical protein